MNTNDWRRADKGDMPSVGSVIALVTWSVGSTSVTVKERMRVEVVYEQPRVQILGPSLPFEPGDRIGVPERPDNPEGGSIIMWKERDT